MLPLSEPVDPSTIYRGPWADPLAQALMDYGGIIYLATVAFLFMLLVLAASRLTRDWRQWAARFALTAVVFVGLAEFYQLHRALMYPKGMLSLIHIVGLTGIAFAAVAVVEWALRQLLGRTKNE